MTFPLSKTLDPADFDQLTEELAIVDRHFTSAREQHSMRKWEYSLALRAFAQWGGRAIHDCVDVGGAGSPFWRMLPVDNVCIVDPEEGHDLAGYLATHPRPRLADAVFCLSVIEHVDDLDQFLYDLSCLVAPGGLLFLTMDCCGCADHATAEQHHFHWMRKRIFTMSDFIHTVDYPYTLRLDFERTQDFQHLGDVDYTYHGNHVYDYSFASLALVKRS